MAVKAEARGAIRFRMAVSAAWGAASSPTIWCQCVCRVSPRPLAASGADVTVIRRSIRWPFALRPKTPSPGTAGSSAGTGTGCRSRRSTGPVALPPVRKRMPSGLLSSSTRASTSATVNRRGVRRPVSSNGFITGSIEDLGGNQRQGCFTGFRQPWRWFTASCGAPRADRSSLSRARVLDAGGGRRSACRG